MTFTAAQLLALLPLLLTTGSHGRPDARHRLETLR